MAYTLITFVSHVCPARLEGAVEWDCHEITMAASRTGPTSSEIVDPPRFIIQQRFKDEATMQQAMAVVPEWAGEGAISVPIQDFPQCEQPELPREPMLFVPVKPKDGLDKDEFHARWHSHGPLIQELVPGVRGYVQHHVSPSCEAFNSSGYDGVARFWFDDIQAVLDLPKTDRFDRIVQDEDSFLSGPLENYVGHRSRDKE